MERGDVSVADIIGTLGRRDGGEGRPHAAHKRDTVRGATVHKQALSLAKTCSMGLKSGL